MFPFPNFTQIMDTLKQLPTTWWGKLLPGRSPGLPIPDVVRKDAARLEMTEKILARMSRLATVPAGTMANRWSLI